MVIAGIGGILSIFISGLSASFGDVIARGELKTLQKTYKEFELSYYILISIVYAITFVTIMPFINIYTRNIIDTNYNLPIVGFLFVLNGLLYNIKTPQGMLVISAGLYKETKIQTTIQGLIAVIGGIILAPFLGISGVLIGSILSNIYRDIDLIYFIPKNVTKTSYSSTVFRVLRILLSVALVLLPFFFINYVPVSFVSWIIYAICVAIYATIIVFIVNFIFDKKEIINVLIRLKGIVVKR